MSLTTSTLDFSRARRVFARCLLWGSVVMILARGLIGIFAPQSTKEFHYTAQGFPAAAAAAFGEQFIYDYFTLSTDKPDERRRILSAYMSDSVDAVTGWQGSVSLPLKTATAMQVESSSPQQATVTVAVLPETGRWLWVQVPVWQENGSFVITASPVFVPTPSKAFYYKPTENTDTDIKLAHDLTPRLKVFFTAFAGNDPAAVEPFVTPNTPPPLLGSFLRLQDIAAVVVEGTGQRRYVTVRVQWSDDKGEFHIAQSYALTIVHHNERWLIEKVGPVLDQETRYNSTKTR